MIISASYKTDIPAFYSAWFLRRLAAGQCRMVNPWNAKPITVPLDSASIDGFVLWTRNIAPLSAHLGTVAAHAPFMVQYTITGYPRALEAGTVPAARAIAEMHTLRQRFGPRAAVWRYDPILFTSLTGGDWHRRNFTRLAKALRGTTDEVVISFAQIYRKTRRNLEAAALRHGFTWHDPDAAEKKTLVAALAARAAEHGMALRLCAQAEFVVPGAAPARCVDAARLSDLAGRPIAAAVKGNRPDCLCHTARDIGAYDSCPQGCVYCYAVQTRDRAKQQNRAHDPAGDFLSAPARPDTGAAGQAVVSTRSTPSGGASG
ncbi:MAG: DUF1848 domain-containing protein [Alphaproteobacteria bacterium]|nr:DUF1848 domain-containing protein [Alphaproteobacteria bacterium]